LACAADFFISDDIGVNEMNHDAYAIMMLVKKRQILPPSPFGLTEVFAKLKSDDFQRSAKNSDWTSDHSLQSIFKSWTCPQPSCWRTSNSCSIHHLTSIPVGSTLSLELTQQSDDDMRSSAVAKLTPTFNGLPRILPCLPTSMYSHKPAKSSRNTSGPHNEAQSATAMAAPNLMYSRANELLAQSPEY
jgi:hypothetical protein